MPPEVNMETGSIIREISKYTGLDGNYYNEDYLLRRIRYRIECCGLKDAGQYLDHLRKNKSEVRSLIDCIGVNVTGFFRDRNMYDVISRRLLPQMIARKKARCRRRSGAGAPAALPGRNPIPWPLSCGNCSLTASSSTTRPFMRPISMKRRS